MKMAVILPAAGLGRRFSQSSAQSQSGGASGSASAVAAGAPSKIEALLDGQPVFMRAAALFMNRAEVTQIILAVNPDAVDDFLFRHGDRLSFMNVKVVPGGRKERWETVLNALSHVAEDCTHIAIHDAARPLTTQATITRVFEAAAHYPAVIAALPVSSTLKRTIKVDAPADAVDALLGDAGKHVTELRQVTDTVDRSDLVEVQTPQVFDAKLLREAYAQIAQGQQQGQGVTDDAMLVERLGQKVHVVQGDSWNLKITRPEDLRLAQAIWRLTQEDEQAQGRKALFGADDDE